MQFRTLGSTGLEVSVIGVGTWQYGGEWGPPYSETAVADILAAAKDCGINLIDTAECYGDHLSERLIGAAIADERDRWIVASKFGHHFREPFERDNRITPEAVRQQLDDSLAALRSDYIDLYQFHSLDDEAFATEGLWDYLNEEKQRGRIRHLGISIGSNRNAWQTGRAKTAGAEAIQVIYNRLDRAPEEEVFPICQRDNLGVLARVPLASGYLSGKYKPGAQFDDDDVRARWHQAEERDEQLREVEHIAAEELPAGVPMARWALSWCLQNEAVSCVIPGCKSPEQLRDNAAAADLLAQS